MFIMVIGIIIAWSPMTSKTASLKLPVNLSAMARLSLHAKQHANKAQAKRVTGYTAQQLKKIIVPMSRRIHKILAKITNVSSATITTFHQSPMVNGLARKSIVI